MPDGECNPTQYCLACGYPLDHVSQQACPECGRAFNPADPATFAKSPRKVPKAVTFAVRASLFYPVVMCASVYVTWLAAWLVLGHRPRPSLDDPADVVTWMYVVSWRLMMNAFPAMVVTFVLNLVNIVWSLLVRRANVSRAFLHLFVGIGLWAGIISLLRWDPGNVLHWWFD